MAAAGEQVAVQRPDRRRAEGDPARARLARHQGGAAGEVGAGDGHARQLAPAHAGVMEQAEHGQVAPVLEARAAAAGEQGVDL